MSRYDASYLFVLLVLLTSFDVSAQDYLQCVNSGNCDITPDNQQILINTPWTKTFGTLRNNTGSSISNWRLVVKTATRDGNNLPVLVGETGTAFSVANGATTNATHVRSFTTPGFLNIGYRFQRSNGTEVSQGTLVALTATVKVCKIDASLNSPVNNHSVVSGSNVNFSWIGSVVGGCDITGYQIQFGNDTPIAVIGTSYTLSNVTQNISWKVRAKINAYNGQNYGDWSNPRNVVVTALPVVSCSISPLNPTSQSFSSANNTGNIAIIGSSGQEWSVSSSSSWITVNTLNGMGTGNVSYNIANNFGSARVGTITVSCNLGGASRIFTINQQGNTPMPATIAVTGLNGSNIVPASGGTYYANVANLGSLSQVMNWTTSAFVNNSYNATITFTPSGGIDLPGGETTQVQIFIPENNSGLGRTIELEFENLETTYSDPQRFMRFYWTQSGYVAPITFLNVNQTTLNFSANGSPDAIVMTESNTSWTVTVDGSPSWISGMGWNGNNNNQFSVELQPNPTTILRTTTMRVKTTDNAIERTIIISQEGSLPPSILNAMHIGSTTLQNVAGNNSMNIESNITWIVSCDAPWINILNNSGTGNGNVQYTYSSNNTTYQRPATFTISGGGIIKTIVVNQGSCVSQSINSLTINEAENTYSQDVPINLDIINDLFNTNYLTMPTSGQIGRINGEFMQNYASVALADCNTPCRNSGNCRHKGIDYHAPQGTNVRTPISGTIIGVTNEGIAIFNAQMNITLYLWHINVDNSLQVPNAIDALDFIGTTDNQNHLHLEARRGERANPSSACNTNNNANFPNYDPRVIALLRCQPSSTVMNPLIITGYDINPLSGLQNITNFNFSANISGGDGILPINIYVRFSDFNQDILIGSKSASGGFVSFDRTLSGLGNRTFKYKAVQGNNIVESQNFNISISYQCNANPIIIPLEDWLPAGKAQDSYQGTWFGYSYNASNIKNIVVHHSGDASNALWEAFWDNPTFFNNPVNFMQNKVNALTGNSGGVSLLKYNFFILPNGEIYEGTRGIAWHAKDFNRYTIGICVIGNYQDVDLSPNQEKSLVGLLSKLVSQYNFDPLQTTTTLGKTIGRICAHKDISNTACPGQGIFNKMQSIRNQVANCLNNQVSRNNLNFESLGSIVSNATIKLKRSHENVFKSIGFSDENGLLNATFSPAVQAGDEIEIEAKGYEKLTFTLTNEQIASKNLRIPLFKKTISNEIVNAKLTINNMSQAILGNINCTIQAENVLNYDLWDNNTEQWIPVNSTFQINNLIPFEIGDEACDDNILTVRLSNAQDTVKLTKVIPFVRNGLTININFVNIPNNFQDAILYVNGLSFGFLSANNYMLPSGYYKLEIHKKGYANTIFNVENINSVFSLDNIRLIEIQNEICQQNLNLLPNQNAYSAGTNIKNIGSTLSKNCLGKFNQNLGMGLERASEINNIKSLSTQNSLIISTTFNIAKFETAKQYIGRFKNNVLEKILNFPNKMDTLNFKYVDTLSLQENDEIKFVILNRLKPIVKNPIITFYNTSTPSQFYTQQDTIAKKLTDFFAYPDSLKTGMEHQILSFDQDKIDVKIMGNNLVIVRKRGSYETANFKLKAIHDGLSVEKTFVVEGITSLYEQENFGVVVYPNPASDFIEISFDKSRVQKMSIEIFDLSGKSIIKTDINEEYEKSKINVGVFQNGVYVVKILINDKYLINHKLIVQK